MRITIFSLIVCCILLSSGQSGSAEDFALVGGKVYTSPTSEPLSNGTVLVMDGEIYAVGPANQINIPSQIPVIDGQGLTIMAGFWNSHVHFMESKWRSAAEQSPQILSGHLQEMLTQYGIVHAYETATFDMDNTLALRQRILSGEVVGPQIYTTGLPVTADGGSPVYIFPEKFLEVSSVTDAEAAVHNLVESGADGIKILTASWPTTSAVEVMPREIAEALVAAAEPLGTPVFAHPTSVDGVQLAADVGVDVLAHASPDRVEYWSDSLVEQLVAADIALIPTLKLNDWDPARQGASPERIEEVLGAALQQLGAFFRAGGTVLFGTDIGYMTDYDPAQEYQLMTRAGLDFRDILASLTTAPASRFSVSHQTGRIEPGLDADLTIVEGDPETDLSALSQTRYVYRQGNVLYSRAPE